MVLLLALVSLATRLPRRLRDRVAEHFDLTISPDQEIEVPITQLFITPVRGLNQVKVDSITVRDNTVEYDRLWVIVNRKKKAILSNNTFPNISLIDQEIVYDDEGSPKLLRAYL